MKIGFIGSGKMAQAIISGILAKQSIKAEDIIASANTKATRDDVYQKYSINVTEHNSEVAQIADVLFLAIPPEQHMTVIDKIRHHVKSTTLVITIAAGLTMKKIEQAFEANIKMIRTMPNTPSLIGEGMTAYCYNQNVTIAELDVVKNLLSSFGKIEYVPEGKMDAIPGISGASPAYVYMMIEALADGGVREGLSRQQAYQLAAQAVLGAAKMVLETGQHPGELKDQVCSPGGATIEAVAQLEANGFRHAILEAMNACTKKVEALGQNDV